MIMHGLVFVGKTVRTGSRIPRTSANYLAIVPTVLIVVLSLVFAWAQMV
jgi:hypothetical protein